MEQFERLLRLALKAQSQCRATLETLAVIRNPPVFARQANIANGPQQVNNGVTVTAEPAEAKGSRARGSLSSAPIKLLEKPRERMDGRAAVEAGESDSAVATVGAVKRAAHG
jgi:hypothetical protein